jgi:hypothetical protein
MAYTGCLDGAETDEPDNPAMGGLAIFEHPGNRGFPNPVYTTSAEAAFGFLAAAPLMHGDLSLGRGEVLQLRYRTLILSQEAEPQELSNAFELYRTSQGDRKGDSRAWAAGTM